MNVAHFDEAALLEQVKTMIAERRKQNGDAGDDAETRMYETVLLAFYGWFVSELNHGTKPAVIAETIAALAANIIDTFASTICDPPEDQGCMDDILRLVKHMLDSGERESIVGHAIVGGHA